LGLAVAGVHAKELLVDQFFPTVDVVPSNINHLY
jgi:hypothetical protein